MAPEPMASAIAEFDCSDAAAWEHGNKCPLARAFAVERVTRIELAWPTWKVAAEIQKAPFQAAERTR